MNILVVDYICTRGHLFFNKIHIDSLFKTGHNISVVSRRGFLQVPLGTMYYEIPEQYYIRQNVKKYNAISCQLYDIKKVRFTERIAKEMKPDVIVFLTYDALSVLFFRVKYPTFLINHVNIDFLSQWYRKTATKLLPKHYTFVCLSRRIQEYLKEKMPNRKSAYIPHGILNEYEFQGKRQNVIFCPITSSVDETLIREIIYNKDVIEYLTANNIRFVLKTNLNLKDIAPCIKIYNDYIDVKLYNNYVNSALAIFLPYHKSFNNRVSGIFHEALSYKTPILTSNIPSFVEYENFIEYKYTINGSSEFIKTLDCIRSKDTFYKNLGKLVPCNYWISLLAEVVKK